MQTIKVNPGNKEYFESLLLFADESNRLCRENSIKPVVYGSLAYIFHTRDESISINDVDFLIAEKLFSVVSALLNAIPGTSIETTTYHSIKLFNKGFKISFDSVEHYMGDRKFATLSLNINGKEFEVLDREALKDAYEQGVNRIPVKKEAYVYKLRKLSH